MLVKNCIYCQNTDLKVVTHRVDRMNILRCQDCRLMMTEYIHENPSEIYTADYFQKSTETGTGYVNYLVGPAANVIGKYAFARLFGNDSGKHLDLGCADGSLMELFNADNFESSGLDISIEMVDSIVQKGLFAEQSDLTSIPKKFSGNDYVTAFDVFEHSDKPGIAFTEARNVLKSDGYLVFSTLSVQSPSPTDYWFNHSLEHYTYYTKESLRRILTDIFGANHFHFIEIEINGVAELWGVASKQEVSSDDRRLLNAIDKGRIPETKNTFYLSLFLNQISRFEQSRSLIDLYEKKWTSAQLTQAEFFNNFFQGKLELAINNTSKMISSVPVSAAPFWQAYALSVEQLSELQKRSILKESADQVVALRGELFATRDELHSLLNSRVVGRVIKARDTIGESVPKLRKIPRRAAVAAKVRIARYLPGWIRRPIMRAVRYRLPPRDVQYKTISNKTWESHTPLVSIVVPYYNRGDVIDETLASITAQTFTDLEVIIVNDGSTDKPSNDKLKHIKKEGYPATFITQKNQGVAKARNNGIERANGKYIVCLDSDDLIEPTYIEKAVTVLETNPNISIVSSYMKVFGVIEDEFEHAQFSPISIYDDNMIITAAMFTKKAWRLSGGYKSGIGYEDWEFWINLVKHGFWATQIPEKLFIYRTSMQSRYVEDKDVHWKNLKLIRSLHPDFKRKVKALIAKRKNLVYAADSTTALHNLFRKSHTQPVKKANILITVPWMTFGGAETLIYNFCREIKEDYNITFVTGVASNNEWEYKFRQISPNIFHLPNILPTEELYEQYVAGLIKEQHIDTLHIIHNGFTFSMLKNLKAQFPHLRVILTLFNDRAAYFDQSLEVSGLIDTFTSDNNAVIKHYEESLTHSADLRVIPNGINCVNEYNPAVHNRKAVRKELELSEREIAIFFVGRLSEEKNPDVILNVAKQLLKNRSLASKLKFFIIGDGPMRAEIESQMEAFRHNGRVVYLGYQSDVPYYLSAADIFVLPSSIEGFPLSIIEAMAMRVVPIASRVGAIPDVIDTGKNGFVVKPGSASEIAKSIEQLVSSASKLTKMKKTAREKVEANYSNPVLGKNYRSLYERKTK